MRATGGRRILVLVILVIGVLFMLLTALRPFLDYTLKQDDFAAEIEMNYPGATIEGSWPIANSYIVVVKDTHNFFSAYIFDGLPLIKRYMSPAEAIPLSNEITAATFSQNYQVYHYEISPYSFAIVDVTLDYYKVVTTIFAIATFVTVFTRVPRRKKEET